MKTSITKYTLFEYLSGRCNPLERQLVEEWTGKDENTEIFYQWLLEYETRCPQFVADQESGVVGLMKRIDEIDRTVISSKVTEGSDIYTLDKRGNFRKYLLIAATVLLVLGCGWWFRDLVRYKTYQTGYGQTTNLYLEDGSKVALNANSSLKIPRFGFADNVREVLLEGEGEFTISHTIDNKRFVVKTSEAFQVEVLGTVFSVFSRARGTKVALKCGSVRIDYAQKEQRRELMMEPGDLAVLDKTGAVQLEKHQDTKTFAAWTEQRYIFNSTPVKEISAMIEDNFGLRVKTGSKEIAERTITGNFKTKNAGELLKTISEVLDLTIQASGDSILLTNN
ncbi:FecR family protein [Dyadobacter psychrotolerans]|uniref:DUF4974 domain-containing protein n=1 Tax=Dyadobacter psychrotolerans TaxID=2541721 RepID=A0A4R5DJ52_9BACT|nr:FecR domain-containing protein [Dyadobacter psychrotolerans]TDE13367.1 DUF4974 domain-containing protein [Dyadobacter psychrotolerans]